MVRLEDIKKKNSGYGCQAFQFQYGAIRRYLNEGEQYNVFPFQFQYGAIRSPGFALPQILYIPISIPVWCD